LGLLRGLEFTFLKNLRFLKNVGNDKPKRGEGFRLRRERSAEQ